MAQEERPVTLFSVPESESGQGTLRLRRFTAVNLFRRSLHPVIEFPIPSLDHTQPAILILEGPNGSGKTTILQMIGGMLSLDFDIFRRTPFGEASLFLSNGDKLHVKREHDDILPLTVTFRDVSARLPMDKSQLSRADIAPKVAAFREVAKPLLDTINYQLVDIHRSLALRREPPEAAGLSSSLYSTTGTTPVRDTPRPLGSIVRTFIREAQINYRRYFPAVELLPRILQGLAIAKQKSASKPELLRQVSALKKRASTLSRLGLQTDRADLDSLEQFLAEDNQYNDPASLAVMEAYVEVQKNRYQTQELIADRLIGFENIMDDFLVGKQVRVDGRRGLTITTDIGNLEETQLSSGEYHFLYMMVTALLCYRSGSIIAIDEPELSLHVTWQRKVISALARCAAGASPLFLFATHASAISAEHKEHVKYLAVEK